MLLLFSWRIIKLENSDVRRWTSDFREGVIPEFTHTLLLKKGEVYRAGLTEEVLSEAVLSNYFDVPVDVVWQNDRPLLSKKRSFVK